jgi:hypothetical protein
MANKVEMSRISTILNRLFKTSIRKILILKAKIIIMAIRAEESCNTMVATGKS